MNSPLIVCGWFTPDYRVWASKLIASLDAVRAPYDIVEVPRLPGRWEAITLHKPAQLLAAMDRHPGKVVVFLDVDCRVLGDLSRLADVPGDVALYIRSRWRRAGGVRFAVRSGTFVARPTLAARACVEAWLAAASEAPWGAVDQDALMVALGRLPFLNVTTLPVEYCATAGDNCLPVIAHDHGSRGRRKAGMWGRLWHNRRRAPANHGRSS